ncbi:phytoene/squalene synthase family protein [Chryseobacterium indologenes]|uniref:Phytoene/squalene synthase family protein n=1 Tax=Chryseobacterium indologenes TaxID=253 RepID=A0AAD0YUH6_CHRID|nr:phytoene/squalene synthase family protein [Chryseobacterium indologenes]AYZ35079.1 phytoene/squalene synthase family protein [Chryseobacterium indologenes]AZB17708.1 phytoene/squalene synthase family protein [Chryseobacterium indologenes]MBF6643828.1 phytoene/squalene synthase family protein [Chryseobacterium indologenes]MBU3049764.1 phytoene/squalene synthase family protein [Chryseobacterium indologenes]MEB4762832.1 phytoene/squalene synthase family protein [Chryseobacterium indologenes]
MKKLFDELSYEVSKCTTQKYSTSFSLGILALKPSIRPAIYAVYGYVRLADEIVDSFHGYDKEKLLKRLQMETDEAIQEGISLNPILHSFQEVVRQYAIDQQLIRQFLHSMEMDLHQIDYNSTLYNEYIHGSAEVVGLMCLQIFTEGNKQQYEKLKPFAMKLGSAFQKVNFLRDLKDDYQVLGRTYFPSLNMSVFNNTVKLRIEKEIEEEFKEALQGIKKLPGSSIFGVYLAYRYYLSLFEKIKKTSSQHMLQRRIRIANSQKILVALKSYIRYKSAYF